LADTLMSGLALFATKSATLLDFSNIKTEAPAVYQNIKNLFGVQGEVPSDSGMRVILDEVDPQTLQPVYKKLISNLQRGKVLEQFVALEDRYHLASVDGTGYFSSQSVHCENCCEKVNKKTGEVTYYHNMLSAVLCHPERKEVFPLTAPEAIIKQDGVKKNDAEQNASIRCLRRLRREHPHLSLVILEDSLHSKGPHLLELGELNLRYIIGAKPGDHEYLFEFIEKMESLGDVQHVESHSFDGRHKYKFRYYNGAPLNGANDQLLVNFLEFWGEDTKTGIQTHFSWVTDFEVTRNNAVKLMKAGRARWRIENETFNTVKNQGYHFEHNFGHGYKHLSVVLAHMMFLAFFIDQIQQAACSSFQRALIKKDKKKKLWASLRSAFEFLVFRDWEHVYDYLSGLVKPNISWSDGS
jgi:hypothetical protein